MDSPLPEPNAVVASACDGAESAGAELDRKSLLECLKRGKEEWERTFDTIPDSISIIAPDLTIRRANRALAQLVGREPRDLVGHRCHSVLHGLESPCPSCPVLRAFETGETSLVEGETFGTKRVFDYYAYPQKDAEGRVYAVIAYARDVTREEELKAGLRRSEKLVSLGELASGIAHEINNPLTSVSSYAQLLALRLEDPKSAECAARIQEGVERIDRLVRNLMSFVRNAEQPFYPLDLGEIVTDTLSFSRYELTRGETRLVEDLGQGLPKVLGARDQLGHLLVSLLTNARDAVAGRGTITVRTLARNGSVVLEVEDDGVGIPPEEQEKIFEPFYTTKPEGKGTGLGLFVAAGIARNHRAEISVAAEPGRGTRVSVSLPAF